MATSPPDSFERAFQAAGLPRFILDLAGRSLAPPNGLAAGAAALPLDRSDGDGGTVLPLKIRDSFDGIIWIADTSAAVPLGN